MRVQTAHFQIFGGTSPDTTLRGAANRLEAEYSRILGNLGVSSHPVVTVRIWQDAASYYNELTRYFGTRYQAGGYITGPTELRLLAGGNLDTDVVHEFVHAVSLDVNPGSMAQNDRRSGAKVSGFRQGPRGSGRSPADALITRRS